MNIKEDPYVMEFLLNRNIKAVTKDQYIRRLKQYFKYLEMTPTQVIDEAIQEEEQGIRKPNRKIKKHMLNFFNHIKNEGKSPNYIKSTMTVIRSFYNEFEIELPRIRCNIKDQEELITTLDIPTKKHIKTILKYTNIRYKAIILLMMSSGMGSSEIRHLTLNDYLDSLKITDLTSFDINQLINILKEKENEVPTWSIRRHKTKMPYVTFSSPESNRAINEYIEERYQKGYPFTELNDYLFESKGQHMKRKSFSMYFLRLNDTAGFGYYGRQRFFHAHALRKFFASTLKNNKFDSLDTEWLLGHKIRNVTDAYIKPNIYYLKKEYIDILPKLCIEDIKTLTLESEEVKELKKSFEEQLSGIEEKTEPLMWIAKVIDADPELKARFRESALEHNIK